MKPLVDFGTIIDREGRTVPIPANAEIMAGTLEVPAHLPRGVLAYMDEAYRTILWPRCKPSYQRLARQFVWANGGRLLHYRIVDVPTKGHRHDALSPLFKP